MFKDNLKTIRKEKGFSQEQLALRLNVVRQTVSKWEKGFSVPDAELLIKLSEVLGVEVSDLLGEKIEVPEGKSVIAVLSNELAKLNEILTTYGTKISEFKKKIVKVIIIILSIAILASIFEPWCQMWKDFGKTLYYIVNDINPNSL